MKASITYNIVNRDEIWSGPHTLEFESNEAMFAWKRKAVNHPFLKLRILQLRYNEGQYE